jgi:hypothetical protein
MQCIPSLHAVRVCFLQVSMLMAGVHLLQPELCTAGALGTAALPATLLTSGIPPCSPW